MPLSTRSATPTPLVLTPAATSPSPMRIVDGYANGVDGSTAGGPGGHDEVDLSMQLPSRSYLDRGNNDGYRTPVRMDSLSPGHSPVLSKAPLTEPSTEEYQSEQAELEALQNRLLIETKIKDGAENLLQVFKLGAEKEGLRSQIIAELDAANREIEGLRRRIRALQGSIFEGQGAPHSDIEESYSDEDSRTAIAGTLEALRSLSDVEVPSTSSGTSLARQDQKIEILNAIVQTVQRNERVRWEIPVETLAETLLPCLADFESSKVRAATYRTLRHMCCEASDVKALHEQGLDIFMIKSFARNATCEIERTETLLLTRSWLSFVARPLPVPVGLVRALIAFCENSDEKLRYLALETLAEIALLDVHLLSRTEGLRTVLQAFVDGPYDVSPQVAMAFLPIMDLPSAREVLRPGLDIEVAIGAFINMSNKSGNSVNEEKLRTCAGIVGTYLKTWTGLIYLCMNDKQAIKAFLGAITSPSQNIRDIILDTLFEVFRIDYAEIAQSKRNTLRGPKDVVRARARSDSASRTKQFSDESSARLNLVEHYLGLVLAILVEAGLFDMLVATRDRNFAFRSKAAVLVGELLALSTRVLPVKYGTQWQTLPRIFNMAAHFDDVTDRLQSTTLLENIDRYNRQQARQQKIILSIQNTRNRANSLEDPLARGQRHVENSRIRIGMQIDDMAWKNLLLESQVLVTKEHQKWNFEAILEIAEGPLLNQARLNEAIKGTKFLRRIMAFFYPFDRRYSDLENSPTNLRWTKLACSLLTTLVSTPDGLAFLSQDRLLRQIAECLGQLDPNHGNISTEPIFGERGFAATLSSGYFAMLGTLSKYPEGLKLMEKAKVFTLLYHLSDLRGRDDIITAAIENLDYHIDGHARVVLSKALNSPYKHVRLFVTKHIGTLLRDSLAGQEWLIKLIVTQLYDTSADVREATVAILNDVCQSNDVLEKVVATRPSLDHLGAAGAPLLFRFLSTSIGVRYLHEIEFIEREMEHWFHQYNDLYVVQLELDLARTMRIGMHETDPKQSLRPAFDGTPPLHFYGELVKTSEGRMILQAKGHFQEFVDIIRTHSAEQSDQEIISKLKSVLWAVGHIGSASGGTEFLEHEGIVVDIIQMAAESKVLSLRGTCFFVLGLIASSIEGAVLLESCDWNVAYTPVGTPTGYCLPSDLDHLVHLQPWVARRLSQLPVEDLAPPTPHVEREIITAIANLSNNLLTHTASKTLARIKQRHPQIFKSKTLFFRALHLLNTCRYRAAVRAFVLEQFAVPLDVKSVKSILEAGSRLQRVVPTKTEQPDLKEAGTQTDIKTDLDDKEAQTNRRLTIDPMYRLDLDSDSDSTSTDDEESGPVKEVLVPMVVMKGFLG